MTGEMNYLKRWSNVMLTKDEISLNVVQRFCKVYNIPCKETAHLQCLINEALELQHRLTITHCADVAFSTMNDISLMVTLLEIGEICECK